LAAVLAVMLAVEDTDEILRIDCDLPSVVGVPADAVVILAVEDTDEILRIDCDRPSVVGVAADAVSSLSMTTSDGRSKFTDCDGSGSWMSSSSMRASASMRRTVMRIEMAPLVVL
jgi:hypothetical protein